MKKCITLALFLTVSISGLMTASVASPSVPASEALARAIEHNRIALADANAWVQYLYGQPFSPEQDRCLIAWMNYADDLSFYQRQLIHQWHIAQQPDNTASCDDSSDDSSDDSPDARSSETPRPQTPVQS